MKKMCFWLLLATCNCSMISAQGIMVKNHTQRNIKVQTGFMRFPLAPNDSVEFRLPQDKYYLIRVEFINDKNDTCVFRKSIDEPIITDKDLKRYKRFYCPERNGKPIRNRKTQF